MSDAAPASGPSGRRAGPIRAERLARLLLALPWLLASGLAAADAAKPSSHRQVMIQAKFVTATDDFVRGLGFDWSGVSPGFRAAEPGYADLPLVAKLLADGQGETLADPSVVTRSGQPARVQVGGALKLPDRTVPDFGLVLRFVPHVAPEGGPIQLEIRVDVDELAVRGRAPVLTSRVAETRQTLEDGQTVVIGGLYTDETRDAASQIPGLVGIPVLGALFADPAFAKGYRHLIVIVTPQLVDENGHAVPGGMRMPARNPQIDHPRVDPNLRIDPNLNVPATPQYPQQPRSPSYPNPR